MKKIILLALVALSVNTYGQYKYHYGLYEYDSIYANLKSGASTDSVVTVNALGKFFKRNASAFGISAITADNGLTASTSTNVQLGGTLLSATTINSGGNQLILTGSVTSPSFQVTNFSSGAAISGTTLSSSNPGVAAYANNSTFGALYGQSSDGVVGYYNMTSGSNASGDVIARYVKQISAAAASSGMNFDYQMSSTVSANLRSAMTEGVYWTTPTDLSESSAYFIKLLNSGTAKTVLTINGDGSTTFYGSQTLPLVSKATSYTATSSDHTIIVTATGQTITLPTAVSLTGVIYTVKLTASGSCTVATTSSQTIDASTTYSLSAQYKYVTVQSDGANWVIIANN